MTKDQKNLLSVSSVIAGLCLGMAALDAQMNKLYVLPGWFYSVLLLAGIACTVACIFIVVLPSLAIPILNSRLELDQAKASDLEAIWNLANEEIGDYIITKKSLREWHLANPRILWVVRRNAKSLIFPKSQIVGMFSVVPVNAVAKEKLMKNREEAFQVTVESIVVPGQIPAAWYISALAARGYFIRGKTVQFLMAYVKAKASEASLFLTAPTTEEGLNVATKNMFIPTDQKTPALETIFYREING